jgi:hypothetical protein
VLKMAAGAVLVGLALAAGTFGVVVAGSVVDPPIVVGAVAGS